MKVDFERLQWENYPSTNTPLNADNLNRLEEGVAGLYSDVSEIQEELGGGVGEYVTDWLDEHVTPGGSTIVVDDTLTIQGAAADAKKTGDEISSVKDGLSYDLDDYKNEVYLINPLQLWDRFNVKKGALIQSDGTVVVSANGRYCQINVEEGVKYFFAKPDPTTDTGVTLGTAQYVCLIKSDGSYYDSSPTAHQWVGNITIPTGVNRMIVSVPISRLYGEEYSVIKEGTNTNNKNNPWKPRYTSYTQQIKGSKTKVSCIGDSLTAGAGGEGTTYPSVLGANDSSLEVTTFGFPSEDSLYIACATGGITLYADPFTIPTTNTANTAPTITLRNDAGAAFVLDHIATYNKCVIGGVEGYLLYTNGVNKFQRALAGDAVTLTRPEKIYQAFDISKTDNITIIWAGTNDTAIDSMTAATFYHIQDIINLLPHKKYLVLGVMANTKFSNIGNIMTYCRRIFGSHFINIRQYLLDYGLADAGITPTEQDTADIAAGTIPTSLRSDNIHLNASGYTVVGNYLYKVIKQKGWLDN